MNYWLLKTEPGEFSFTDLVDQGDTGEPWTGVRNYQARNFIRDKMTVGDGVVVYHSSCKQVGAVGIAKVISDCFTDPLQFDSSSAYFDSNSTLENPRWLAVQVQAIAPIVPMKMLSEIKLSEVFRDSMLVRRGSRLSVVPLTMEQWHYFCKFA